MENAVGNLHSSEVTEENYENFLVLEQGLRAGIRSQDDSKCDASVLITTPRILLVGLRLFSARVITVGNKRQVCKFIHHKSHVKIGDINDGACVNQTQTTYCKAKC
jgi:hypothetical protein